MTEFEARMQAQAVDLVLNAPFAVALALLVKPMTYESNARAVKAHRLATPNSLMGRLS
jgi:hypothetical protein